MNGTQIQRPPRPVALKPIFDNFPPAIIAIPRWLLWRYEWVENEAGTSGKWDKPPRTTKNPEKFKGYGRTTDAESWLTFDEAKAAFARGRYDGIGFVFSAADTIFGYDADDKEKTGRWLDADGNPTPALLERIGELNTYTERSPSGTGVHAYGFGDLATNKCKSADNSEEIYQTARYFTFTGHRIEGFPTDLMERQTEVDALVARLFPAAPESQQSARPAPRPSMEGFPSDDELLRRAFAAANGAATEAIYHGDMSRYNGDHSRADYGLCVRLAFWSGGDPARLDRMFRGSALMRDKWDQLRGVETYGNLTLYKAIEKCPEFYDPTKKAEPRKTKSAKKAATAGGQDATGDGETEADDAADSESGAGGKGPSVATRLVQIARERFTLWHTDDGTAYATVPVADHDETWAVSSTGFRDQITRAYFAESGSAINNNAMQAALATLSTFARLDGDERKVYTRKADLSSDGVIYIDLCNADWEAVKITPTGWKVMKKPPVSFRRAKGALPLPTPQRGGSLAQLRDFVNMPPEGIPDGADKRDGGDLLIFAWLLAALGPHNPYPILHLMGEQGTAKSNAARCLRALVDPAGTDLRREPKEDRDIAIAAKNAFVVAFDNVSGFPVWLSDTLCTIATGGGFGTRKLHSDDEEALFQYKAPVLMTGIGEPSTRPDFLERALLVNLPVIAPENRKSESDVLPAFEAARPHILGALFDAVSCGLKRFATVETDKLPRMADFARWIIACEPACPWELGAFLNAYNENQAAGGETALDADKIAPVIIRLVMNTRGAEGRWEGTAGELLAELEGMTSEREKAALPKSARSLSVAIKRIAPALRTEAKISVTGPVKEPGGRRVLNFQHKEEKQGRGDDENLGANLGANDENLGANNSDTRRRTPFDDERPETWAQRAQRAQNPPYFSSPNKQVKKEEEREQDGTNAPETSRGENRPGFAPVAPNRPNVSRPASPVNADDTRDADMDGLSDPFADDPFGDEGEEGELL